MSVGLSFYENVFLLMQVVPASFELKKLFRKGMFDKPNTTGFIHISHYLLTIYDENCFGRMITWPILTKKDETQFRMDVKEYLTVLSSENPDINFPPILMSHLLLAGGIKFLIIMWKLSQITLRAYIERECPTQLLHAPSRGSTNELVKIYLKNINAELDTTIQNYCTKTSEICTDTNAYVKEELDKLHKIKIEIFETKKNIEKLVSVAPVNPLIAERLLGSESADIIEMWKGSILKDLEYLLYMNEGKKEIEILSYKLCDLTANLLVDSNLSRKIFHLPNIAEYPEELHRNGTLIFQSFLTILSQAAKKSMANFKLYNLSDLLNNGIQIKDICASAHTIEAGYKQLLIEVSNAFTQLHSDEQGKHSYSIIQTDFIDVRHKEFLFAPLKINFSFEHYVEDTKLFERLWSPPKRSQYGKLFKRYKANVLDSPRKSISRLQLNNTINNDSLKWISPKKDSLVCKNVSPKLKNIPPKYCKLFSTSGSRRLTSNNAASTPNRPKLSRTPRKSKTPDKASRSNLNLSIAAKNLFDLTCEVKDVVASLYNSQLSDN